MAPGCHVSVVLRLLAFFGHRILDILFLYVLSLLPVFLGHRWPITKTTCWFLQIGHVHEPDDGLNQRR